MPKTEIDYTNTIIYKIICKDANINDVYVGHTTNFVQRKHAHKQSCINTKSKNYKCKLYEVIRANGGWANWKMEIINFFECKDHYEARKKEQEYFITLGATLNSIEPLPKPRLSEKNPKLNENKPELNENKPNGITYLYECKNCDFKCNKKSNYNAHILTRTHTIRMESSTLDIKNDFACKRCKKIYKARNSLWYHEQKCDYIDKLDSGNTDKKESSSQEDDFDLKKLILEVIKSNTDLQKQNSELQKQVLEICKNSSITNNNINTNNSHNKTFNLQFFLNEQCKDAMNISDFVNSFDLQLSDLESVGDLGYVEGMTKIFLDKLNTMDIYKRPIHCSDTKREILYVKDEDKWEKEKRNNPKLRDAIKHLSFKNMKLTNLWSNTYPESKNNESRLNDVYMKLVLQSTGGSGEIVESENKIIRRIAKEIFIDKTTF